MLVSEFTPYFNYVCLQVCLPTLLSKTTYLERPPHPSKFTGCVGDIIGTSLNMNSHRLNKIKCTPIPRETLSLSFSFFQNKKFKSKTFALVILMITSYSNALKISRFGNRDSCQQLTEKKRFCCFVPVPPALNHLSLHFPKTGFHKISYLLPSNKK